MKETDSVSNVIDFTQFKEKKLLDDSLARGRTPLYLSHLDGKVRGKSPHFKRPSDEDMGDRMQRIKTSLEKINYLMNELKKSGKTKTPSKPE